MGKKISLNKVAWGFVAFLLIVLLFGVVIVLAGMEVLENLKIVRRPEL